MQLLMKLPDRQRMLDNSACFKTWRHVAGNSRTIAWTVSVWSAVNTIFTNSRVVDFARNRVRPLFLVDNYLDRPSSVESRLVADSVVWDKGVILLKAFWETLKGISARLKISSSMFARALKPDGGQENVSPGQHATAFFILFVVAYYLLRQVLILVIPAIGQYAGWAAGWVIGAILSGMVFLLSRRNV